MKSRPIISERELLLQLQAGDEHSFAQLYDLYSPRMFGFLLKLTKKDEAAREILQEVFIRLWEKRYTLDPDRSFRSYLFRIAENCVVDFFRKAAQDKKLGKQLMYLTSEPYLHVEEGIYEREKNVILNRAINLLPPQRKRVFELCKFEGKSYKEVSLLMGISVSTISDHLLKATRAIRQHILLSDHIATLLSFCIIRLLLK
ncbi:RNA polymerase sigma-70 factor [Chitinophaga sp. SYP-B3965]|uniref:RNA polymerase sigma factor n=1 Tax=Chitinophaga sp. SYP-B3965 TaxID=2663120 RepID=UPI001299C754|nr:RNA polymerase sigma-70 factor [Chitinophaga sp. SYP-B3965]MRG47108.1 RNA polymerase sigma-70 factor [Chitinophaga sp. SYP-B3965]